MKLYGTEKFAVQFEWLTPLRVKTIRRQVSTSETAFKPVLKD